jgi:hypothetical protein
VVLLAVVGAFAFALLVFGFVEARVVFGFFMGAQES